MDEQTLLEEKSYLTATLEALREQIGQTLLSDENANNDFSQQSKYLWEEVEAYYAEGERGFDRLGEMLTNLEELNLRQETAAALTGLLRRYRRMLQAPYFARIDFREAPDSPTYDEGEIERIYIGRASLTDGITDYVYDWRTPVASLFYRADRGPASFEAPAGTVFGDMTLKRQYIIKRGELSLYVDSDLRVADELLGEALSRASTGKMHSVVETIQSRQDEIIRDTQSEILLVQGAAGSGKTAVALHRIAFLLYEGQAQRLTANDVLMLSPSAVFEEYIDDVLPELGEEQLRTQLYEELASPLLPELQFTSRLAHLDRLCSLSDAQAACWDFLGSWDMVGLLDRALERYVHRVFPFRDIWYNGALLFSREEQKSFLLRNPYRLPYGERLRRLAQVIADRLEEALPRRQESIARLISADPSRTDPEQDAHGIAVRELKLLRRRAERQLTINGVELWQTLLSEDSFFAAVSHGMTLPEGFDSFRRALGQRLAKSRTLSEDSVAPDSAEFPSMCAALYLQVRLFGAKKQAKLRQLVIDEAQDMTVLQFATLALMAPHARVTAVGDPAQSLTEGGDTLFQTLTRLYPKRRVTSLRLTKSYRSTAPITAFCNTLTDYPADPFPREGEEPVRETLPDEAALLAALTRELSDLSVRYPGVAVIAPDARTAQRLASLLPGAGLLTELARRPAPVTVLPVALSKGLEFDAVLIPYAERYQGSRGRRALYVACTRALHVLRLYGLQPPTGQSQASIH